MDNDDIEIMTKDYLSPIKSKGGNPFVHHTSFFKGYKPPKTTSSKVSTRSPIGQSLLSKKYRASTPLSSNSFKPIHTKDNLYRAMSEIDSKPPLQRQPVVFGAASLPRYKAPSLSPTTSLSGHPMSMDTQFPTTTTDQDTTSFSTTTTSSTAKTTHNVDTDIVDIDQCTSIKRAPSQRETFMNLDPAILGAINRPKEEFQNVVSRRTLKRKQPTSLTVDMDVNVGRGHDDDHSSDAQQHDPLQLLAELRDEMQMNEDGLKYTHSEMECARVALQTVVCILYNFYFNKIQ